MMLPKRLMLFSLGVVVLLLSVGSSFADQIVALSSGQTLYVPVYSHVYSGPKGQPFQLAVMLSFRNTDPQRAVEITSLDYYDNDGRLVKHFLDQTKRLPPLASHHVFIQENDELGGFGANFIVRWQAAQPINPPRVESVMIGARSGQGISFVCPAQPILESAI